MKQYVVCKDEAERAALLAEIDKLGYTWIGGEPIRRWAESTCDLSIGYDSGDDGITYDWNEKYGKQTTIPRFLLSLQIEKLKAARRALPKLEEES
jgi:hypothetical protein